MFVTNDWWMALVSDFSHRSLLQKTDEKADNLIHISAFTLVFQPTNVQGVSKSNALLFVACNPYKQCHRCCSFSNCANNYVNVPIDQLSTNSLELNPHNCHFWGYTTICLRWTQSWESCCSLCGIICHKSQSAALLWTSENNWQFEDISNTHCDTRTSVFGAVLWLTFMLSEQQFFLSVLISSLF